MWGISPHMLVFPSLEQSRSSTAWKAEINIALHLLTSWIAWMYNHTCRHPNTCQAHAHTWGVGLLGPCDLADTSGDCSNSGRGTGLSSLMPAETILWEFLGGRLGCDRRRNFPDDEASYDAQLRAFCARWGMNFLLRFPWVSSPRHSMLRSVLRLPWWSSGGEYALQCRGHWFNPWSRKILHALW